MKKNNQHIINQVNIEINTASESKAFEIKSRIDSFLKEELFPKIELLFDETASPEEIRRFESIDLELKMHSTENFDVLTNQMIKQLHEKINQAQIEFDRLDVRKSANTKKKTSLVRKDRLTNSKETFLYFLETGRLPWHAVSKTLAEFTQPIHFNQSLQDKYFFRKLKSLFSSNPNTLKRFVQQFDDEIITCLITQLSKESQFSFDRLWIQISVHSQTTRELLYFLVFNKLIQPDYQISKEELRQLQNQLQTESQSESALEKLIVQIHEILLLARFDLPKFLVQKDIIEPELPERISMHKNSFDFPKDTTESEPGFKRNKVEQNEQTESLFRDSEVKDKETTHLKSESTDKIMDLNSVYIQNAGLILAHPFLRTLFAQTACTSEKGIFIPEKQIYAVHLLHFLSTGQEMEMEHELTFEKFLCGVPLHRPIERKIELSEQDKLECNDLLKSMISNWPVLKNTSPEGLRQTFFQRNGKLDLKKSPCKLYVERKAFDILLDQLPWNISMVKLPWMNDLILVEW